MEKQRVVYLIRGYWERSLTKEELIELAALLKQDVSRGLIEEALAETGMELDDLVAYDEKRFDPVLAAVLNVDKKMRRAVIRRRSIWLAAASVIAVLGLGFYFYFINGKQRSPVIAVNIKREISAPTTNRAMITLADGSRVFLDSVANGQLAQQGNIKLVKLANGQVAYQTADGQVLKELQYNTLTNPRGSKVIDIRLSDGSHVWLNAGSSITYPVAFAEHERRVELKGEGYFEVAKDKARKFIVSSNGITTEVLGTHFNVSAYNSAVAVKITLLEGAVRAGNNKDAVVIKPGQQAVAEAGSLKVNESPNLDQVMAWKNGFFNFDGLQFTEAMAQLEQWYDVEIGYQGRIPDGKFYGDLSRSTSLSGIMKTLEVYGIAFKQEGRKITVSQK